MSPSPKQARVKAPVVPELRKTKVGGQSRDWQLVSVATGGFIAQVSSEDYADAILAAVNAHASLVQQLEGNLIVLGNLGGNHTPENPTARQELVRKAWLDTRDLLAKFSGGAA